MTWGGTLGSDKKEEKSKHDEFGSPKVKTETLHAAKLEKKGKEKN